MDNVGDRQAGRRSEDDHEVDSVLERDATSESGK